MRKIIRKDLILESCGQKEVKEKGKTIFESHEGGCYIRFSNKKIFYSYPRTDVTIDFDEYGKVVGIGFYDGFTKEQTEK